ncbi:hypothetical protein NI389_05555 [Pseudoalteromonas xiamenensis]|uniref:hypothetical protein n=1 Tax=Pseudoalteromonas xiamenensis TaxID=882626 RepID=UPI0027E5BC4C|nr:hypothetical protein [Pseudoalteromonas xiamenensis]WMN60876.1 hypothetical protein NI389_05555 [Pseudoalteromonas xiamenensis]
MNKRIEPELFSLTPDLDQVEDYKQAQTKSKNNAPTVELTSSTPPSQTKTSRMVIWLGILAVVGFATGGYALYKQNLATLAQLHASELRIGELERALSATGEEMGQSAGAIQAKLSAVATRTDELWEQMDKLWASAWRRNQSEIKDLKEQADKFAAAQTQQIKQQSDVSTNLKTLSQTQTELTLKMSLLQEQLQVAESLKGQLTTINTELDKVKSQSQTRDTKQLEIGANMAQLEITQNALAEQIERLEKSIAAQSKVPSSPN